MKIYQLLSELSVALTNEEHSFVKNNKNVITFDSLHEREKLLAHNLVRKGIYEISKDNSSLIKRHNDSNT